MRCTLALLGTSEYPQQYVSTEKDEKKDNIYCLDEKTTKKNKLMWNYDTLPDSQLFYVQSLG